MRFLKPNSDGTLKLQGNYNDTGCITLSDLLHEELDYSFLSMKASTLKNQNTAKFYKCRDKRALAKKIALDFLELLIDDLIQTGNVFIMPVQQGAQIKIVAKPSKAVKSISRRKAYGSVDLFNSDFKIYEFVFDFYVRGKLRRRYIRINQERYQKIVEKVNNDEIRYFDGFF